MRMTKEMLIINLQEFSTNTKKMLEALDRDIKDIANDSTIDIYDNRNVCFNYLYTGTIDAYIEWFEKVTNDALEISEEFGGNDEI